MAEIGYSDRLLVVCQDFGLSRLKFGNVAASGMVSVRCIASRFASDMKGGALL
jgi:hypothetical protein